MEVNIMERCLDISGNIFTKSSIASNRGSHKFPCILLINYLKCSFVWPFKDPSVNTIKYFSFSSRRVNSSLINQEYIWFMQLLSLIATPLLLCLREYKVLHVYPKQVTQIRPKARLHEAITPLKRQMLVYWEFREFTEVEQAIRF